MNPVTRFGLVLVLSLSGLVACDSLAWNETIPDSEILAVDALRADDPEGAARKLEALLADKPRDSVGWTILGHIRADLGQTESADAAYQKSLALNPKQVEAMTGLGIIARRQGNYERAMEHYRQAVKVDPDYAQGYSSMTTIALKLGQDKEALRYARKGYDLDRTDPVIVANLAIAYHYAGNMKARDRMAKTAREMGYSRMETLDAIFSGEMTIRD